MAHSFIEAFDDEAAAFESLRGRGPNNVVLLLDTRTIPKLHAEGRGASAAAEGRRQHNPQHPAGFW